MECSRLEHDTVRLNHTEKRQNAAPALRVASVRRRLGRRVRIIPAPGARSGRGGAAGYLRSSSIASSLRTTLSIAMKAGGIGLCQYMA